MSPAQGTILVTGASGQQGSAVLARLRDRGYHVRALTRSEDKLSHLKAGGVQVAEADMTDRRALDRALEGVSRVFAMATPFEAGEDAEVRQGITLGEAAADHGIEHYIYSSVGAAERNTGIPHFVTKTEIEQRLTDLGLPLTILRPVWFMENFNTFAVQREDGRAQLTVPLSPDTKLQMVAVDDVAKFVVLAFDNPDEWIGTAMEIAGDELTMPQTAKLMTEAGLPTTFAPLSINAIRAQSEDFALMYEYFEREGYKADIPALRQMVPSLRTFGQWLDEGNLLIRAAA